MDTIKRKEREKNEVKHNKNYTRIQSGKKTNIINNNKLNNNLWNRNSLLNKIGYGFWLAIQKEEIWHWSGK